MLLNSEIHAVPEALELAAATLRTIRQNLFWAFFYNAAAVPLAAFAAAGFLMKFSFPILFIALAAVALVFYHGRLFTEWKKTLAIGAVFAALVIPVFVYNYQSTGSPIGLIYEQYGKAAIGTAGTYMPFETYFLLMPHVFTNVYVVIIILLATAWAVVRRDKKLAALAIIFWVTLIAASVITSYKEDRYILFLQPLAFLLAAVAIAGPVGSLAARIAEKKEEIAFDAAAAGAAVLVLLSATFLNMENAASLVSYKIPSYGALRPAGEFIQTATAPGEWIASNSGHELAFYAKRYAAWIDADISKFKQTLSEKNITVIAITVYEQRDKVIPAFQKFEQKTLGAPENSFEYILAGVSTGEFQIIRTINEKFGDQEATSVVVFRKAR